MTDLRRLCEAIFRCVDQGNCLPLDSFRAAWKQDRSKHRFQKLLSNSDMLIGICWAFRDEPQNIDRWAGKQR